MSLYPLSLLFRFGTKMRNLVSTKKQSALPIICIGNIVVGGAGKTPVSLKMGKYFLRKTKKLLQAAPILNYTSP